MATRERVHTTYAKKTGAAYGGHPMLFSFEQALRFEDFSDGGGFPRRFLLMAYRLLAVESEDAVLHVCSGSVRRGTTVDVRFSVRPKIVADGRKLPFRDESFPCVLLDPPYGPEQAREQYGTDYPSPGSLLREAARVVRAGGRIGLLHYLVPMSRAPLKIEHIYGVTTGLGQRIRAFTVLRKAPSGTFRHGR